MVAAMVSRMALVIACAVVASAPASAAFHLMKVVEVFPGAAASPNAQYVVLQMYANNQNVVGGHDLTVFDAAGTAIGTVTFGNNVATDVSQAKILIATTQAATFFNVAADFTLTTALPLRGGKVCFDVNEIDCVAWGNYAGTSVGVGTPYAQATGLVLGRAAIRRLDILAPNNTLQDGDDTNQSNNDFVDGIPAPRNNAGLFGTIPAAFCGNAVVEGLEQCDGGRGCSATCNLDADVLFTNGFE